MWRDCRDVSCGVAVVGGISTGEAREKVAGEKVDDAAVDGSDARRSRLVVAYGCRDNYATGEPHAHARGSRAQ
jgi:hypothetical protein